jgi:PAS domain S-box-containing protein
LNDALLHFHVVISVDVWTLPSIDPTVCRTGPKPAKVTASMTQLAASAIEMLWRNGEFDMCRGRREGETAAVLILTPTYSEETTMGLRRLEHEYSLAEELDAKWSIKPLTIVRHNGRPALILADPGGQSLDRLVGKPLEIGRFLRLAIGLTGALGQVHQRGLIHKDIKPINIFVDDTDNVRLTGFGIASRLPRERQPLDSPEVINGTFAYMAPEQTGRMNRSIDARSDLYSLGVTLYELVTGGLPFTSSDPMELIHCHIARQPISPANRAPETPAALADIILKLLAKTAEERYQTAAGVEYDLTRCLQAWEAIGRIDSIPLGLKDASSQLLIPEKLYGRESEIAQLLSTFDRVVDDGMARLVLVSGYSGIGKSSVVNELHKVLVPPRGLFASGKFDQFKRDIPYATLAQAFRTLICQILSKSDAELAYWRDALRDAISRNGQLIVNLIPELELIIGKQSSVTDLPPQEAQVRFQTTFRRFLRVFAKPEHPLALFLDDLQWLDAATLQLLEHLITDPEVCNLMLVGAYRDNEVSPAHPLARTLTAIGDAGAKVHRVVLNPLTLLDVGHLVADSLRCTQKLAEPLAGLIYEKTGGNPFFAIQFFTMLAEEELLEFDAKARTWTWDLARIKDKGFTDNVVDLMANKLDRLPENTQNAMKLFACLGNSSEITTLTLIYGEPEEQLHEALWEGVRAGLICRLKTAYAFVHDKVQESAYRLLPEEERAEVHLGIGRALVARTAAAEVEDEIFQIVNQFDRGVALISSYEERNRVAELNLMAGKRAKASAAYASALVYFAAGCALLAEDSWQRQYRVSFDLNLYLSECEFLTGELSAAESRLSMLVEQADNFVDYAAVTCVRLALFTNLDRSDRAVEVGLDCLREVGIDWPLHPTQDDVRHDFERMQQLLGDRSVEQLLDLPLMTNPEWNATMIVLSELLPPAGFVDGNLLNLVLLRMVNLSLEHGNSDASCFAYSCINMVLGYHFDDYQTGFRFGQLSHDLVETRGLDRFKGRAILCFGAMAVPWAKHLSTGRPHILRAFEAALESGDQPAATYSCNHLITNLLGCGAPLADVLQEITTRLDYVRQTKFGLVVDMMTGQLALVRVLRGLTPSFASFDAPEFDERHFELHLEGDPRLVVATCWYWIRKLQARFFAEDNAAAIEAASKAKQIMWSWPSFFEEAEYHFFGALALAAHCDSLPVQDRASTVEAIVAHQRKIKVWAEGCPENFGNRAALVAAELARLGGLELAAQRLYEDAIRLAREGGFIQNEAIAYELAARFYLSRGFETIAFTYLRNARSCYDRWGAVGKVRQLEQRYSRLREAIDLKPDAALTLGQLELATVVKMSQAVSGEIILDRLIEKLMVLAVEHAGAARALLILRNDRGDQIEASAVTDSKAVTVCIDQTPITPTDLPGSVLRYVMRAQDSVILDDASVPNQFSSDEYFGNKSSRSVFCLPLVKQTVLIGVLYLENNLTPYAFTPNRVGVLKLLATQAAISLENARLYAELQHAQASLAEDRRRAEESSQRVERELRAVINTIPAQVWTASPDGNNDFVNQRWLSYTKVSFDETSEISWDATFHPADVANHLELWRTATATGKTFENEARVRRHDGTYRWFLFRADPLRDERRNIIKWYGTNSDIEDRKQAEHALRRGEAYLAEAQRLSLTGSFGWIPSSGTINWSEQSFRIFEYDRTVVPTIEKVMERVHPDDAPIVRHSIDLASRGEHDFNMTRRLLMPDGSVKYVHIISRCVRDKSGNLEVLGAIMDVTAAKHAEHTLRENEQRFRDYAETASDWLWESGVDHRFTYVSSRLNAIGVDPDKIVGTTRWHTAAFVEDEREKWRTHKAVLDAHEPFRGFSYTVVRNDGSPVHVTISGRPIFDESGQFLGYRGVGTDITSAVRAEQAEKALDQARAELSHVTRITTLGELTASIAHEVNQPLMAIVTNAAACLLWLANDKPDLDQARKAAERVIRNGHHAGDVVKSISSLARKVSSEMRPLDINSAIEDILTLLDSELRRNQVCVERHLISNIPMVLGNRVQLQQIILNLTMNAMEAMNTIQNSPKTLRINSQLDASDRVLITVEDSGPGIDSVTIERIFDPLFTTKADGMGIGLSICRSLVEAHGGRLWVSLGPNGGSSFQFTLPCSVQ